MREVAFFAESGLVASDLIVFAKAAQLFSRSKGRKSCWSLAETRHVLRLHQQQAQPPALQGTGRQTSLLALLGQYPSAGKSVIVRRHICTDPFCRSISLLLRDQGGRDVRKPAA